jgi:hypothetical protein
MPSFLVPPGGAPYGGVWPAPAAQNIVVPNCFTIPLVYDPATMSNPAVSYADLYAALKTAYAGSNYPVFPGSQLETLVNLLAGAPYDLDAINAVGIATISTASTFSPFPYNGSALSTGIAVARDGYFDLTDALSNYTGAATPFSFRLNAFLPFTVEEQGGCSAVIRPAAYKQTKPDASGVDYTAATVAVPLLWPHLAAALKPSNLVAQFISGTYPTPVDFQRSASRQEFAAEGYSSGAVGPQAYVPWGFLTGVYTVGGEATGAVNALNPFLADGDFGGVFTRLSCAHSIIQ